jgi:Mrp family chromosome partitioning ATPase
MNGRRLPAVLWRRRWTAWCALVVLAAGTALWLAFAPRSYTATALITVTPQASLAAEHGTAVEMRQTLAQLASSVPVLADARGRLSQHRSVAQLLDETSGKVLPGTALVRVSVTDHDRTYASNLANAVAAALPRHDPTGGEFRFAWAGRASGPTHFSEPDITEVVVVGVAAAVVLAICAALLHEALAGTVDDPRQLEALADTPVLAALPRPSDVTGVPAESDGRDADRFRALRVALEFVTSAEPTHIAVLAPVVRDDAAGWLTVNLATALAQVQHRVLIVDADFGAPLRHPELKGKGPGLADVLRGDVELAAAVRPCTVPGVSVLPAGKVSRGSTAPSDLIEMHFHKVLGQLDGEVGAVDIVLVNAAPLAESVDARVMAVGNVLLLTVPSGRVRARTLRSAAATLHRLRLRLAGAILLGSRTYFA